MAKSFLSFAKRYCAAHHNGYGWVTDGASNIDELRMQLHGVMLRRTKDDVLDLPPKIRTWLDVDVREGTGRRETREVLRALIGHAPRTRLLASITKARQRIAIAKTAHTIEFVEGAVAQDEKVIVFTGFEEPATRIHAHFGDAAVLLTGATPADRRQSLVDRFQNEDGVRVFVANLVASGIGLNLTAARQVVFNDLDWTPANHWQAEDRAYRIGQTNTVNVTYLLARDTIDGFVARALAVKSGLIQAVVEGDVSPAGDVLRELESLMAELSPISRTVMSKATTRSSVCCARQRAHTKPDTGEAARGEVNARTLPADAIDALIRPADALRSPLRSRDCRESGARQSDIRPSSPNGECSVHTRDRTMRLAPEGRGRRPCRSIGSVKERSMSLE